MSKSRFVARHRGDGAFNDRRKITTEDFPMQYLLTIYANESGFQRLTKNNRSKVWRPTWPTLRRSSRQAHS